MTKLRLLVIISLIGSLFWYFSSRDLVVAATGILKQINFQGKVANNSGTNVTDGDYSFTFKLYTVSSAGSPVWTETKTITVTNGIFQTLLGDTTTLPGSVDFNTDNIYLGIEFNSDGEMSPRIRFSAVPYAMNALKVAGLTVTDTTGTLTIPNAKTISFADSFTTSGANALTLTTTGATNVTLPTTGTLTTLAGAETLTNKTIGAGGLTFSNLETISNGTNGTITLGRNDAGTVTVNAADDDSTAALTINSGGAAALTLDAGGAAGINIGTTNANAITIGNSTSATTFTFDKGTSGNFVFRSNGSALDCSGFTNSGALTLNASGQLVCSNDDGGAGGLAFDTIGDAAANGAVAMAEYAQTLDWNTAATAAAFDGLTITITNDAGTDATTQRALVVQNLNDGGATGTTEALLTIDNADANEAVTSGLLITSSGAGGMTYGINLNDTDIVTDFSLQFGETIDNNVDGTLAFTLPAAGLANILTGNLKVGNGTPTLTLGGEDAYIEGTFEVDDVATFGSNVGIGSTAPGELLDLLSATAYPKIKLTGNTSSGVLLTTTTGSSKATALIAGASGSTFEYDSSGFFDILYVAKASVGGGGGTSSMRLDGGGNIGIGTTTISARLHAMSTTEQVRIGYNSSNYASHTVSSAGDLTVDVTGGQWLLADADTVNVGGKTGLAYNAFADSGDAPEDAGISSDNDLYVGGSLEVDGATILGTTLEGAGLTDCDATGSKLLWDATAKTFSCGTDRASAYAINAADDTVNNTTTLANVTDMSFSVGTNETWVYQMYLIGQSNTAPDFRFAVTAPASSTCSTSVADPEGGLSNVVTTCGTAITALNGSAANDQYIVAGYVATAGTSGTVQLQFAQNTVNASDSIIRANSYLLAFKVSGADLAEVYYSADPSIIPGTVVSLDPSLTAGVKKSQRAYDPQVMGIVSTKPGLVIGDAGDGSGSPVFVALSGRVPVQVTSENGPIEPGDFLTPSSTPGKAMKATKAGAIIGQAMTGHAPQEDGMVMAFVNTSFSHGSSVVDLFTKEVIDPQEILGTKVLTALAQEKDLTASDSVTLPSEIFTDRVTAGLEIITPHLTAETLTLTKGLTLEDGETSVFSVDEFGNVTLKGMLTAASLNLTDPAANTFAADPVATLSASLSTLQSSYSALLADRLTPGLILGISLDQETNTTLFSRVTAFFSEVIFKKPVTFQAQPHFNADSGGFAKIKKGAQTVKITFKEKFAGIPVVSASPYAAVNYALAEVTDTGFIITLPAAATEDVSFSWTAIAVSNAKTFESTSTPTPQPENDLLIPTIAPSPSAYPSATPEPTAQEVPPSQDTNPAASPNPVGETDTGDAT